MRLLTVALLSTLLLPSVVEAAEVPPLVLPGTEAGCTAPTGFPGELIASSRKRVQFVTATRTGLQKGRTFPFEYSAGCSVAASQANGAGVLAIPDDSGIAVSLRAPGGDWTEPERLEAESGFSAGSVAVAVSEAGEALVVWQQNVLRGGVRLLAARRLAGGTFAAPVTLAERRQDYARASGQTDWLAAGLANGGEAIVAWTDLPTEGVPHRADVHVAIAPANGSFGAPVKVGEQTGFSTPALAMALDGRALLAVADPRRVRILERTAGTPFGAPSVLANVGDPLGTRTAAALGAPGEAVVTWSGAGLGGVHSAIRHSGSAFSGALLTASANRRIGYDVWTATWGATQDLPSGSWGFGGANVHARIVNGAALLGWSGPRARTWAANLATYALGAGAGVRQTIGGELANAWNGVPLVLADGTIALAWEDGYDRIRLATDAPADTAPLPEVRVGKPKSRRVGWTLALPFRCSAACEVRAEVADGRGYGDTRRLDAAGTGQLRLTNLTLSSRLRPVRIRFTAGNAHGRRTRSWTKAYRLASTDRVARPLGLKIVRAERRGARVQVTLQLSRPAQDGIVYALGGFDRRANVEPLASALANLTEGRREHTVSFPADGVRWVAVLTGGKRTFVRVR